MLMVFVCLGCTCVCTCSLTQCAYAVLSAMMAQPEVLKYVGLRSLPTGGSFGADAARRLGLPQEEVSAVALASTPQTATSRFGVPLVPLLFFYDKTHICEAEHYRK